MIRLEDGRWRHHLEASAFFVDETGTALTTSWITEPVRRQPQIYRMFAVKDGAFYGVNVVCANPISRKPSPLADYEFEKDVAIIKIIAPDLPFDSWGYNPPNNDPIVIARRHSGSLPTFQSLTMGSDPRIGDRARIAAYGQLLQLQPIPRPWSADGQVTRVFTGSGGVPLFAADFGRANVNWIWGAVIVNDEGFVLGMSAWSRSSPPAEIIAISASALQKPCP